MLRAILDVVCLHGLAVYDDRGEGIILCTLVRLAFHQPLAVSDRAFAVPANATGSVLGSVS